MMMTFEVTCIAALFCLHAFVVYTNWSYFLVTIVIYFGGNLVLTRTSSRMLDIGNKAVLITGCDTGFGHHLATRLDDKGFTVFAGVLNEDSDGSKVLQSRDSGKLHVIKLDVTKDDDVRRVMDSVNKTQQGLWGVVNNAGVDYPGDVELTTMEQYMKCADVNLYGMIRVIKAALPLVRESKGRIVNVSSVKGRYAFPSDCAYIISKHGVEAMSDSLRLEMKKFGVKVCVIEPGIYDRATSMAGPEQMKRLRKEIDHMWDQASDEVKETYGRKYFNNIYKDLEDATVGGKTSSDPVLVAIQDALFNVSPQARYIVPGSINSIDQFAVLAKVYNFLPEWLSDWIVQKMTGCASLPD